jgi:hypothetical protein
VTESSTDYKRAGRSTRELAHRRYKARVRFVLPMVGVVLLLSAFLFFNSRFLSKFGLIGAFGFVAVAVVVRSVINLTDAREKKIIREERRAVRGAKGEEAIGSILDSLGDSYLVIHDVDSPYGNIDHIVVAQHAGIFLIETKAHGGRVSIANGRLLLNDHEPEKDFIAQALKNTFWLRDRVREATGQLIWINAVVAFTNAFVQQAASIKGVRVINQEYLSRVLQQSDRRRQSVAVWENRKKIESMLLGQTQ